MLAVKVLCTPQEVEGFTGFAISLFYVDREVCKILEQSKTLKWKIVVRWAIKFDTTGQVSSQEISKKIQEGAI